MKYSGREHVDLGWGRSGKYAGFLVQFMRWINATWPHPEHRLINKAGNGVALQTLLPCLFGSLPPRIDLVVLEVGSLAKWLTPSSIELAVRKFRVLPHPPAILFVTVPLWYAPDIVAGQDEVTKGACQARYSQNDFKMSGGNWGAQLDGASGLRRHGRHASSQSLTGSHAGSYRHASGAHASFWSRTEEEVERVCAHYGQAALSVYKALAPAVRARRPGFALADVARDCVHPMHGRLGSEYVSELMVHWLVAPIRWRPSGGAHQVAPASLALDAGDLAAASPPVHRLPRALNGRSLHKQMRATTACYFLHADGARTSPDGETTWLVVPWRVAQCDASVDDQPLDEGAAIARACEEVPRRSCPAASSYTATLTKWKGVWPRGWIHCEHTISPQPRQMKNLAAFTAGALAYLSVAAPGFLTVQDGTAHAELRLLHLISYEHMGRARVSCLRGCTCESRVLDAHRVDSRRNVSIYVEEVLPVVFTHLGGAEASRPRARPRCKLALRILRATSSGEHRWVLTRVTVTSALSLGAVLGEKQRGGRARG